MRKFLITDDDVADFQLICHQTQLTLWAGNTFFTNKQSGILIKLNFVSNSIGDQGASDLGNALQKLS